MIQYVITNERVGVAHTIVADYSGRVQGLAFASNNRGFAECSGFVPMGLTEAFGLYGAIGGLRVQVADTSSGAIYDGRVEDIAIDGDGVTITALGFGRSLSDAPYTALWSTTNTSDWMVLTPDDYGSAQKKPEMFVMDTNNRLFIGTKKGAIYGASGGDTGDLVFKAPDQSSRNIVGISFDYELNVTAGMAVIGQSWSGVGYTAVANFWVPTIGVAATTLRGNVFLTLAACNKLTFAVYNGSGAPVTETREDGATYLKITNIRIVTSTANMVSTTITAIVASATPMTVAVVSTARMYPGQRLIFTQGPTATAACVVASITDATHFVTNMNPVVGTWLVGDAVQAHVIYGDEIADDLIAVTSTLNPGQLSSSTALTQTPGLDLLNETYVDRLPASVMDYLVGLGDTSGNLWEWGVRGDQRLYMRPQNGQRTWYIDASDLDIQRTLDQLTNSIYAVYSDASGRTLRATATSDAGSVARYGLTRRAALSVNTTSAAQAAYQQAVALNDGKEPRPRAGVVVTQVFDANGSRWPLWYVAAGDTVVIRNLSPSLGTALDRVRVFRLTRAAYSFANDTLTLEPETPIARLDVLLAQLAAGVARQIAG